MPREKGKKAESKNSSSALNVRPFPEELLWECRVKAAQHRQNLREFVIDALRKATVEA